MIASDSYILLLTSSAVHSLNMWDIFLSTSFFSSLQTWFSHFRKSLRKLYPLSETFPIQKNLTLSSFFEYIIFPFHTICFFLRGTHQHPIHYVFYLFSWLFFDFPCRHFSFCSLLYPQQMIHWFYLLDECGRVIGGIFNSRVTFNLIIRGYNL